MANTSVEDDLRDFARLQVRAGLLGPEEQLAEVIAATRAEMPHTDAAILARAWLAAARQQVNALVETWPPVTDFDRLQAAFAECDAHQLPVLQGIEREQQARERLEAAASPLRGLVWFTPSDVWHAVDHAVLEVNVWHPSAVSATPDDHLFTLVRGCLERHGLATRFGNGRLQVAAHWDRRP